MGHDHGNIDFPQNANGIDHPFQELFQNLFVEENQRIHGLILGRGCDVTLQAFRSSRDAIFIDTLPFSKVCSKLV
jgi:hypothetical protein